MVGSDDNEIPMAKLQASWIAPPPTRGPLPHHTVTLRNWTADDGEIIFNEKVRCTPGMDPVRILGVMYGNDRFHTHVENVVTSCEKAMRMLNALSYSVKAEKMAILYRGLVLSRVLYACDAWYPYITVADRDRLAKIHYSGCLAITGVKRGSSADATCYEAGFRSLPVIIHDELVTIVRRSVK